jgi:hypothetical protein
VVEKMWGVGQTLERRGGGWVLFALDFIVNSLTEVMGPSTISESNLLIRAA